jgi:hypothetical protein
MIDTVKKQKQEISLAQLVTVALWIAALVEMLATRATTKPVERNEAPHWATPQDLIHYGITSGKYRAGRNTFVGEQTDEAAHNKPAPRPQDLAQLSASGHGRVKDIANGVVVYEAWYRHGKLHGEHGAALIRRDPETGTVLEEAWMKGGEMQRATAPAWIQRDGKTGVATLESWWTDGKRHRIDAPAQTRRDARTGQVTEQQWFEKGEELNAVRLGFGIIRDVLKNIAPRHTLS